MLRPTSRLGARGLPRRRRFTAATAGAGSVRRTLAGGLRAGDRPGRSRSNNQAGQQMPLNEFPMSCSMTKTAELLATFVGRSLRTQATAKTRAIRHRRANRQRGSVEQKQDADGAPRARPEADLQDRGGEMTSERRIVKSAARVERT